MEPIVVPPGTQMFADGITFCIRDWRGSWPALPHVHHADDEAWHVLQDTLRSSFGSRTVEANAGSTVFVPAGVAHTYQALDGARYLLILTPRLRDLIAELQSTPDVAAQAKIYRRYESELV